MWLPVDAEYLAVGGVGRVHAARRDDVLDGSRLRYVLEWPTVCGARPLALVLVEVEGGVEPFVAPFPPPSRTTPVYGPTCTDCMLSTGLRRFGDGSAIAATERDS